MAAIGLGKFGAIHFAVDQELNSPAFQSHLVVTEDDMLVMYADTIVEEWETVNKKVDWPPNVDPEAAQVEADYPKPIWAEANKRWTALDANAQDAARNEQVAYRKQVTEYMRATIKSDAFKESFGAFDLLWAILALGSAFKLGCGITGGGED